MLVKFYTRHKLPKMEKLAPFKEKSQINPETVKAIYS